MKCCGTPIQCEKPEVECAIRTAHAKQNEDRPMYHPLREAMPPAAQKAFVETVASAGRPTDPPGPANAGMGVLGTTGGAKLKGAHYYRVTIGDPMSDELGPYTAECADIIEALDMTFNEGEAFKALWRLAAGRTLGLKKNDPQYDADKVAHYGGRVAVQVAKNGSKL